MYICLIKWSTKRHKLHLSHIIIYPYMCVRNKIKTLRLENCEKKAFRRWLMWKTEWRKKRHQPYQLTEGRKINKSVLCYFHAQKMRKPRMREEKCEARPTQRVIRILVLHNKSVCVKIFLLFLHPYFYLWITFLIQWKFIHTQEPASTTQRIIRLMSLHKI